MQEKKEGKKIKKKDIKKGIGKVEIKKPGKKREKN